MTLRNAFPLAVLVLSLAAQKPSFAQQDVPAVTFQVEVNYVDVDTIVTDGDGNFVEDLRAEDFEILEDGKPQKIEMFSYVEVPLQSVDRFGFLDRPIASDTRSNRRSFDGRVYVLVLDDLDISPLRASPVKMWARQFVERHLGAND